jgi:hypothetical protein
VLLHDLRSLRNPRIEGATPELKGSPPENTLRYPEQ